MTLKFNRVQLRFELRHCIARDDDALGVYDFEVSLQGRGFRSNRNGDDLFSARCWLQGEGFTLTETKKKPIGRGQWGSTEWVEHWSLYSQPEPLPEPPRFRTIIQYDRAMHCYALVDGIDAMAHASTAKDAYWLQLEHEFPAVADKARALADHYPQMETRALKAGQLVAEARVSRNGKAHSFDVASQTHNPRLYRVSIPPDQRDAWTCEVCADPKPGKIGKTCPDIAHNAPQLTHGKRCKHMAAAYLWTLLQKAQTEKAPTAGTVEASTTETGAPVNLDDTTAKAQRQATASALPVDYPRGRAKLFKA